MIITFRTLGADELHKLRDIDRAEVVRTGYRLEGGRLVQMDVNWDSTSWLEGNGPHSLGVMIGGAERCLALGGTAFGAFEDERLVGIAIYRPELRPGMGRLVFLHVSKGYRRRGIASRLFQRVLQLAARDGAGQLYVSATPSGSAVGFYLRHGFVVTNEPDPQLLAEEPEDIHMVWSDRSR